MLVFRSLTVGLLGACVLLLAQLRPGTHVHLVTTPPIVAASATSPTSAPTIINIVTKQCHVGSGGFVPCFATDLVPLLQLAPDEHVAAIGDTPVDGSMMYALAAANGIKDPIEPKDAENAALELALWTLPKEKGRYVEIAISNGHRERRVLVLMN